MTLFAKIRMIARLSAAILSAKSVEMTDTATNLPQDAEDAGPNPDKFRLPPLMRLLALLIQDYGFQRSAALQSLAPGYKDTLESRIAQCFDSLDEADQKRAMQIVDLLTESSPSEEKGP